MKIVSYNVNGIRAALQKGLDTWLIDNDFDIVCFQETKAEKEQVDTTIFEKMGYHQQWFSAQKKGYSGVLILSKIAPQFVTTDCGIALAENEGRLIRADFEDFTLINCYFPSGTSGDERQDLKMLFLDDMFHYIEKLKQERPNIILVGDYNVAHNEIDIHDPKGNKNTTGFLPNERAWMTKWFESGFVDAFRYANPDKVQYSWWSYRFNSRAKDKGWRIDYQSVSTSIADKIESATQLYDAHHSDHCPVLVTYKL
jgi:exodeoxyribonuclease III